MNQAESTPKPQEISKRTKAYFEVLRPVNCIFGALSVLIGMLNSVPRGNIPSLFSSIGNIFTIICGLVVYFIVAGASNLINDYFDLEIDKIKRPKRPMPRGDINETQAMQYFLGLSIAAIGFSIVVGLFTPNPILIPLSVAFFLFVGYIYAWKGKPSGFPGNLIVGISFSFGVPFGTMFIVEGTEIPIQIWFFYTTSALLLISRELVKGMEDMEGDKRFNIKTIANTKGTGLAMIMSLGFSIAAMVFFSSPLFFLESNIVYYILVILGDIAVVGSMVAILRDKDVKKNQSLSSLLLKGGAFLGLIAFVVAPF